MLLVLLESLCRLRRFYATSNPQVGSPFVTTLDSPPRANFQTIDTASCTSNWWNRPRTNKLQEGKILECHRRSSREIILFNFRTQKWGEVAGETPWRASTKIADDNSTWQRRTGRSGGNEEKWGGPMARDTGKRQHGTLTQRPACSTVSLFLFFSWRSNFCKVYSVWGMYFDLFLTVMTNN